MYPNLYYFLYKAFGIQQPWGWTRYVNTFGFFVALSFIAAAIVLASELRRMEKNGWLHPREESLMVGKPASISEILLNAFFGFLVGYKLVGIFFSPGDLSPQDFIFSSRGNWPAGIILAGLFGWLKFQEKNKQKLSKPEERKIRVWPHERVGDMAIIAAFFGFLGAKIFDNLENWDRFVQDPLGNLLSPSGLTFYGGLIVAAVAVLVYAKRKSINLKHLVDAAAPGLMLAYAVGRIGCQVSGDGDWGISNTAYVTKVDGTIAPATDAAIQYAINTNHEYFKINNTQGLESIPHAHVTAPSFIPDWMVAYAYPHNVNSQGFVLPNCPGNEYCRALPIPVFPTPVYETIVGLLLFVLLWSLRKKLRIPGQLFGVYLVVNGIERFFIEKIRVNTKYESLPFHPTQAELIALLLIIGGAAFFFLLGKKKELSS